MLLLGAVMAGVLGVHRITGDVAILAKVQVLVTRVLEKNI